MADETPTTGTTNSSLTITGGNGVFTGTDTSTTTADTGTGQGAQADAPNWEDRYKEAQAWGTRQSQEAAENRRYREAAEALLSDDPDAARNAAEFLGLQLSLPEPDDTQVDDLDPRALMARLQAEVAELKAHRDNAQETQQQEAQYAEYRQQADPELTRLGVPTGLLGVVADTALGMPRTDLGRIDYQGAVKHLEDSLADAMASWDPVANRVKQSWEKAKRAPLISQTGVPGQGAPNLDEMTTDQRHEWMAQRLADISS